MLVLRSLAENVLHEGLCHVESKGPSGRLLGGLEVEQDCLPDIVEVGLGFFGLRDN